eukprot:3003199-Prymnesium_polylepis.1
MAVGRCGSSDGSRYLSYSRLKLERAKLGRVASNRAAVYVTPMLASLWHISSLVQLAHARKVRKFPCSSASSRTKGGHVKLRRSMHSTSSCSRARLAFSRPCTCCVVAALTPTRRAVSSPTRSWTSSIDDSGSAMTLPSASSASCLGFS